MESYQPILADKRKRKYSLRRILDALLYLTKTGCQWRMLPDQYPPWQLCAYYFGKWTRNGTIVKLNSGLVKLRRRKGKKEASPSVVIIDSQSAKCSEVGVEQTGFDGGKKVKGRKRHLVVDGMGLVLAVSVSAANVHDSKGAMPVLKKLFAQGYGRIEKVLADGGYMGTLKEQVKESFGWILEAGKGLTGAGFKPAPMRWKVERTIAWMNWDRRLAKDYECNTNSSESIIYLSNIHRMIRNF